METDTGPRERPATARFVPALGFRSGRRDCVAEHGGFELAMSFQEMSFEMSDEFPVIPRNLGTRDFSRASCEKAPHSLLRRLRGRHIGRTGLGQQFLDICKHETYLKRVR